MSLEFTSMPPAPRGMNLAGPPLFIDDAYCRWMQDILVDRPGEIRQRGPLTRWKEGLSFSNGQQILGACETINPAGAWRTATFITGNSDTSGSAISDYALVKVFDSTGIAIDEAIELPFVLNTQWNSTNKHWEYNTIIDAKPALGGGVWIGVTDGYGVLNSTQTQALMYWRGAGKATVSETTTYIENDKEISLSTNYNNVESGMFVFDITDSADGYGRYIGVIGDVDTAGQKIILEKEPLITTYGGTGAPTNYTSRTLEFRSFRGFVHQHGRGLAATDGGVYITSGRLGSDAEGFFKAARTTIGSSVDNHRVYAYRQSDHQFIGRVEYEGTVSNTQVKISGQSNTDKDYLSDDAYFIIRDDADMTLSADTTRNTKKYSMLAKERVYDSKPFLTPSGIGGVYTPFPGVFNSTYANRQWFASVGNTAIKSDKFVNRVVFSERGNPENINLSPDASDSIIIPGREAIRGIAGSVSGLLVFVENKTYIIKGTNRSTFALEELYPDGTLCTSSIVQVGGGVIWAGKQGIYYYDGVTVRNFTNQPLGIYYTDGVHSFDPNKDRIYAFVFNNYLVINFTQWDSNYTINRYQAVSNVPNPAGESDPLELITLDTNKNYTRLTPNSITFNIYLPTGAIGTLSNFTPRGFVVTNNKSIGSTAAKGLLMMNRLAETDTVAPPTENTGEIINLSTMFTEVIDEVVLDVVRSNDANYSTYFTTDDPPVDGGITKYGPDFYIETKQYNFGESTLRKWWRKMMFNLRVSSGQMMVEFVDINNLSLVSPVTGLSIVRNDDESGYFLIPATGLNWKDYEDQSLASYDPILDEYGFNWKTIEDSGLTWAEYFGNKFIRYSRWLGYRRNSLGFRIYGLHGYTELDAETELSVEVRPELIGINDWVFGLKPLRKGRN